MKKGRNVHVPKTSEMRQQYSRYIRTVDYEPTVDERLNLQHTSKVGQDLTPSAGNIRRPVSTGDQIKEHLAKNWLAWLLCLIGIAVAYLVYGSKVATIEISSKLDAQGKEIQDVRTCSSDNQKSNQQQDVKIAETAILLSGIQKSVDETRDDVKDLQRVLSTGTTIKSSQPSHLGDAGKPRP